LTIPLPSPLTCLIADIAVDRLYPQLIEALKHHGTFSVSHKGTISSEELPLTEINVELKGYEFDPWNLSNVYMPDELKTALLEDETINGIIAPSTSADRDQTDPVWLLLCIKTGPWSYMRLVLTVQLRRPN
jgi:hypothetical protein